MRLALPSGAWGIVALLLWWGAIAGFCYWLLSRTREQKKKGFLIGIVGVLLCVLPFALAFSRVHFDKNSRLGIIIEHAVALRSSPDDAGKEVVTIHEGTKIKMLEELSGWWKVQLPNGELGWLSPEVFEEI